MDSMNNSTGSMTAMMTPWLHFGNTDNLIFKAWQPSSHGAVAGACIGLFMFCILERYLAAYRRTQELCWRAKTLLMLSRVRSDMSKEDGYEGSTDGAIPAQRQPVPPFMLAHDIPRGIIQTIQSTFMYTLMLTIMTFNGAYIISVILGLGVGEVLFGRMGRN